MKVQLELLKQMLIRNSVWAAEVESALGHAPDNTEMAATIHKYASLGAHHSFPRLSIAVVNWTTDAHFGNCLESCQLQLLLEVQRSLPAENATALETQYEEIQELIDTMADELTELSYGEGNTDNITYLGHLLIETNGAIFDDIAEEEIVDPDDTTQKCVWWSQWTITPQAR